MAAGTLSSDQQQFVNLVASGTGLDPKVVTAWVGTESGWGVNKSTHNYLNIGPGRQYQTTDQAANAVVSLLNSPTYTGIKSAIPQGPQAQIAAIGSSRWGTQASTLNSVAGTLIGGTASAGTATATSPGASVSGASLLGDAASGVVGAAAKAALSLVFVVGALALVGMGISQLSNKSAGEAMGNVGDIFGKVGTATKFAGAAAL